MALFEYDRDLFKVVEAIRGDVVLAKQKEVNKLVRSNRRQLKSLQRQSVLETRLIRWEDEGSSASSMSSISVIIESVLKTKDEEEEMSAQVPIVTSSTNEDECFQVPSSLPVSTVFLSLYHNQNETQEFSQVPIITIPYVKRLPPHSAWVNTPRNYVVHDDEERRHCPYFDESTFNKDATFISDLNDHYNSDDEHIDVGDMSIFYDTVKKLHEIEKTSKLEVMHDEMWKRMIQETTVIRSYTSKSPATPEFKPAFPEDLFTPSIATFEALSQVTGHATPQKLRQKFVQLLKKWHPTMRNLYTPGPNLDEDDTNKLSIDRATCLDSYRQMFCRKCFLFNCSYHIHDGISSEFITKKAIPKLPPLVPCSVSCYLHDKLANGKKHLRSAGRMNWDEKKEEIRKWGLNDVSLCRVLLAVFPESYCIIAEIMGTNCRKVEEFVKSEGSKAKSEIGCCNTKQPMMTSRKATSKTIWTKAGASHSQFLKTVYKPCFHPGTLCTSAMCSCIESQTPCEKFCVCAVDCAYRARGCQCSGRCDTRACPCYAAHRECDPELCSKCGAHQLESTLCRNVGIQRQMRKHLKLAESDIPNGGWGIFSAEHIVRGELISEYVGELITDGEADRRGLEYQKRCHTFLFELNSEYSVDAIRKGSKIRFANHADRPNTIVKIMKVNTDHRIGVYALMDIFPGEELFLDYKQVIEEHKAVKRRGSSKLRRHRYPSKTATERTLSMD